MFTGIVTDIGEVASIDVRGAWRRLRICCSFDAQGIALGASIACSGPCLTVVDIAQENGATVFDVDAAAETLARTSVGGWRVGSKVNLERALKIGDELGGHIVTGHVDGLAQILSRDDLRGPKEGEEANMARFWLEAPRDLSRFIAQKGSVTLDGVSLTVNEVEGDSFSVLIIPHTLSVTTLGGWRAGDAVNLEVDLMARYAARLVESTRA
jgi:riboflavin synthase